MRHIRGNAVPETALTVSFTLLVLYGIVQLATTAFYQVSADGAAFVGAHDTVAAVGDPTSANVSSAKSAASVAFSHIVSTSISAVNPSSSTFETDVTQQVPGISAIGNPQALTITSRLVEATSGSSASPSPLFNCTQSALHIVNGANSSVISTASTGLLQATSLLSNAPLSAGGSSVLQLNTTALTGRITTLSGFSTDLKSSVTDLGLVPSLLGAIPLISTVLSPVTNALGTDLEAPLAAALSGTFSSTSALATIDAQLISQVPLVAALGLLTPINALLTTSGTGVLASNGPLAALNADAKALQTIDAGAAKCS